MHFLSVFIPLSHLLITSWAQSEHSITSTGKLRAYDQYNIIRFHSNNITHVLKDVIQPMTNDYDIWTRNTEFIDIKLLKTIKIPNSNEYSHEIIINDINSLIEETYDSSLGNNDQENIFDVSLKMNNNNNDFFYFKQYHPLQSIYLWLDLMKSTFPNLVTIENIGTTFENEPLKVVHISSNNSSMNPKNKTILITGGIHAREWISISTTLFTIYQLLTKYGASKRETKYIDSLNFLIIPIFNPDGYKYTWTNDRLWRKNRQETYMSNCQGIDLDHSFGYKWDNNFEFPCSEEYSGQYPMEALEVKHWDTFINDITTRGVHIYGFLDLHSYSQDIIYPYAYSCDELPRDYENLLELSYGLSKAIRNKSGKNYKVVAACKDRGSDLNPKLGSGTALDYMYHNKAYWAFQLKLRDTGNHGFLLPPKYILPVAKETYAAIKYFCDFILNPEI
ncbi:putative metallocarboxypeptidase NDAI_0B04490 [Naumovozyma dairenensis CBS 421]|uniref:Inactive metallocarboxypeptidase ECM14 n=1 Tax=Naumovozyma dairenensis (strain ATCC 10597 / BCRC 20456 / CBS 421 / NBRC 0211 / NRRL Y-12639) TaxID=1071378 RepID=G0W6S3_NAUDC|nr:hypothetical protein NDAI_0B04490 [Naumovozyma dairenensis CBS 421]CCD23484.1 hypothetical protein NDAI_0B04490 [Naumovozyma dairenensis CBS 421]